MEYLHSVIAGVLQGAGEFLPISGSGHRLLINKIVPFPGQPAGLTVLMQLAVLLAVLLVFRNTVWQMITGFAAMVGGIFAGTFKWRKASRYQMLAVYVLVALIPVGLMGLVQQYYDFTAKFAENLLFVGIMMLATAGLLFIGSHSLCHGWTVLDMKTGHAFKLGLFRAVACLPGLSPTATTLTMGINMGFKGADAAEFTFVLSIPALLGSVLWNIKTVGTVAAVGVGPAAVAVAAAFLAAFGGICLTKWLVKKEKLGIFMIYCILTGVAAIVLNFV